MKKFVVYESLDKYCLTSLKNYNSYIQNTREVHSFFKKDFRNIIEFVDFISNMVGIKKENIFIM